MTKKNNNPLFKRGCSEKLPSGLKVMIIVSFILMVADFVTTMMNTELAFYLETNPIFVYTKSFAPLLFLNIIWLLLFAYFYVRGNPFLRFVFSSVFVWMSTMRVYAIKNAVQIYLNPPTIEAAMQIADGAKVSHYYSVQLAFFIPLIISVVPYIFWRMDHEVETK